MKNCKNLVFGIVATLIAMVAGVYVGTEVREEQIAAPSVPDEAVVHFFNTALNDTEGKSWPFAQWKGKTLVINFWASWCSPCREEMPVFSSLHTKYSAKNVQFVGISLDTADNVINFSRKTPVTYPLLIADPDSTELTRQLGNSRLALPYTVVLDANGQSRLTRLGRVSEQELDALLQKITTSR